MALPPACWRRCEPSRTTEGLVRFGSACRSAQCVSPAATAALCLLLSYAKQEACPCGYGASRSEPSHQRFRTMTRPGPTRIILSLARPLLSRRASAATCLRIARPNPAEQRPLGGAWMELRVREDMDRLKLTPEQVAQVPSHRMISSWRTSEGAGANRPRAFPCRIHPRAHPFGAAHPEQRQEYAKLTQERRARFPRR